MPEPYTGRLAAPVSRHLIWSRRGCTPREKRRALCQGRSKASGLPGHFAKLFSRRHVWPPQTVADEAFCKQAAVVPPAPGNLVLVQLLLRLKNLKAMVSEKLMTTRAFRREATGEASDGRQKATVRTHHHCVEISGKNRIELIDKPECPEQRCCPSIVEVKDKGFMPRAVACWPEV